MKHTLLTLVLLASAGLLSACGSDTPPASSSASASAAAAPAQPVSSARTLVVYFTPGENMGLPDSADAAAHASIRKYDGHITGDAGVIARMIAKKTGAALFSIRTEKVYPPSYDALLDIGQAEKSANERPRLTSALTDLENYDTIFLVYPMWWHDLPMAMHTFLDTYDLSGKTIIPYVLHGGGGPETTPSIIQKAEPGARFIPGADLNGYSTNDLSTAEPSLDTWLTSLGY